MNDKIAAYEQILKIVNKNAEALGDDRVDISKHTLETVVHNLKISERFGIPLKHLAQGGQWLNVKSGYDDWTGIGLYGEKHNRTIGCSDDNTQPKDEWLFAIRFTTGAYIFGDSYPTNTFQAFWHELKAFGAKYSDSANSSLYFTEETAKNVYDNFWPLFKKYKEQVGEELKAQRKEKLLKELEELSHD